MIAQHPRHLEPYPSILSEPRSTQHDQLYGVVVSLPRTTFAVCRLQPTLLGHETALSGQDSLWQSLYDSICAFELGLTVLGIFTSVTVISHMKDALFT